jgi:hypothetical protein
MSYPKKNLGSTASMTASQYGSQMASGNERDTKALKRREQLHTLLTNKFRGKYQVDVDEDKVLDNMIKVEVARFLDNEQMTEVNLVKLDKKLGEILSKRSSSIIQGDGAFNKNSSSRVGSRVGGQGSQIGGLD